MPINFKNILVFLFLLFPSFAFALVEEDLFEDEENIITKSTFSSPQKSILADIVNIFSKDKNNVVSFDFDETKTYPVRLNDTISTIIHLPEKEEISFFSVGNSNAFEVVFDENIPNMVSVKTLLNNIESNLVIRSKLGFVYNFYLSSVFLETSSDSQYNFTVYIKDNDKFDQFAQEKTLLSDLKENNDYIKKVKSLKKLNTSYKIKGDKEIAPVFVYDDGKWTYFDFGKNFVSDRLPNVYKLVDKYDSVTNTRIDGNLIIAQALSSEGWSLKNGTKIVCIHPRKSLFEVYSDDRFK